MYANYTGIITTIKSEQMQSNWMIWILIFSHQDDIDRSHMLQVTSIQFDFIGTIFM